MCKFSKRYDDGAELKPNPPDPSRHWAAKYSILYQCNIQKLQSKRVRVLIGNTGKGSLFDWTQWKGGINIKMSNELCSPLLEHRTQLTSKHPPPPPNLALIRPITTQNANMSKKLTSFIIMKVIPYIQLKAIALTIGLLFPHGVIDRWHNSRFRRCDYFRIKTWVYFTEPLTIIVPISQNGRMLFVIAVLSCWGCSPTPSGLLYLHCNTFFQIWHSLRTQFTSKKWSSFACKADNLLFLN